ncbi:hypothetical protein G7Y89_g15040 [Cudoniella acicularis]|uniref:Heterokaryon incompatibility domain-containing protein n=1 Tax=Cudoniella acicularis TaxID=354080 RepID=A0A8H4QUE8_9HELO|nr:hypothetical protein G7Y89_g15040 [Cudoniella acicularis]
MFTGLRLGQSYNSWAPRRVVIIDHEGAGSKSHTDAWPHPTKRDLPRDNPALNPWQINPVKTDGSRVKQELRRIQSLLYDKSRLRQAHGPTPDIAPSILCEYCRYMFASFEFSGEKESFRFPKDMKLQDLSLLEKSATYDTCHFCCLRKIWKSRKPFDASDRGYSWASAELIPETRYPGVSSVLIFDDGGPEDSDYERESNVKAYCIGGEMSMVKCSKIDVFPQELLANNSNNATGWALTQFWIEQCLTKHELCQCISSKQFQKLPTRLIDLGPHPEIVSPSICYSRGLKPDTKYTTLSHRWSGSEIALLTFENHDSWCQALPISEFSLLFRDAMEATKCLGLRYLWIDSLCIIQNSPADWLHESTTMDTVYQNSYIGFTALNPHSGLFSDRNPKDLQPCVIESKNGEKYYCFDKGLFAETVDQNPLFSRAWVLQEYALAPRILHFTPTQIFFECQSLRASESFPLGIPACDIFKPTHSILPFRDQSSEESPKGLMEEDSTVESILLWGRIMQQYSEMELTFPEKDKLAALSGIAKRLLEPNDYLAGLWRPMLEVQLLWTSSGTCSRPEIYQAPSWSWASVNGFSFYASSPGLDTLLKCERESLLIGILDAGVSCVGKGPTGPVNGGWLSLRGYLACFENGLYHGVSSWPSSFGDDKISRITCYLDTGEKDFIATQDNNEEKRPPTYLLPIIFMDINGKLDARAHGLVLEATGKKGEFYRRGIFAYTEETPDFPMAMKALFGDELGPGGYETKSDEVDERFGIYTYNYLLGTKFNLKVFLERTGDAMDSINFTDLVFDNIVPFASILTYIVFIIYNVYFSPLAKVPGPFLCKISILPSWYHALTGYRQIWLWQCHQIYGPTFRLKPNGILFSTPSSFRSIYSRETNVLKTNFYILFRKDAKDISTACAIDPVVHTRKRRLIKSALTEKAVRSSEAFVIKHIDRLFDTLTFDLMGDLCFGRSFDTKQPGDNPLKIIPHTIHTHVKAAYAIGTSPFLNTLAWLKPQGLDSIFNSVLPRDVRRYFKFVDDAFSQRMSLHHSTAPEKPGPKDLFHYLLSAKDPLNDQPYHPNELLPEAVVFVLAGSDTAAIVMSAFFFYMTRNPRVYNKLQREIRDTFKEINEVQGPKLASCIYLRACIDECMRMSPGGPSESPPHHPARRPDYLRHLLPLRHRSRRATLVPKPQRRSIRRSMDFPT